MNCETGTIVFGAGCFWCTEAVFQNVKGVQNVTPGYTGGTIPNPTYEEVCTGTTGHIEVAKVDYDPRVTELQDLLKAFFKTHDPTSMDKQGNDTGSQYRSAIFWTTEKQKDLIDDYIKYLDRSKIFNKNIVTEVRKLETFYKAEDYHQNYYDNHKDAPYCRFIIAPKLEKLKSL
ncbi:MAG: peptide-methionine (S)-S-oxide reductase MsrA [Patescibacteria group bacterium]